MGYGVVGIEFDGAPEFLLGARAIPHPIKEYEGERGVGLGGMIVKLYRLFGRGQSARVGLAGGHQRVFAQQVVAIGEADIGRSVVGVVNNGLGERVESLVQTVRGSLFPVEASF